MAKIKEQFIVDPKGKKTAVILSVKEYERLLEDLHDLSVIAERRHELNISLDDIKCRFKIIQRCFEKKS